MGLGGRVGEVTAFGNAMCRGDADNGGFHQVFSTQAPWHDGRLALQRQSCECVKWVAAYKGFRLDQHAAARSHKRHECAVTNNMY